MKAAKNLIMSMGYGCIISNAGISRMDPFFLSIMKVAEAVEIDIVVLT